MTVLTATLNPQHWHNPNQWAVYAHLNGNVLLWVGYCRAPDVLQAPDARDSAAWMDEVAPLPHVTLAVLSLHETGLEAMRAAGTAIRTHRPPVNGLTPLRGPGNMRRIKCEETGAIFGSAADACRTYGIHKSQMSVYLSRRDGKKLKGLTFRYVV